MLSKTLTEREQEAIAWARGSYPHWRKRWSETFEQHMTAMRPLPSYYAAKARQREIAVWRRWFYFPFGEMSYNVNAAIVRRLLRQGRV